MSWKLGVSRDGGGGILWKIIRDRLCYWTKREQNIFQPQQSLQSTKQQTEALLTRAGAKGRSKATPDLSHTPPKTQSRAFFNTRRGETAGVRCQDIIKTKSWPPLGKRESDQSPALFQVGISFQLLKLMNSLCCLMKPSAANEVDASLALC